MIDPTGDDPNRKNPHRFARPCPSCGYPQPDDDAPCPECGLSPEGRDAADMRRRKLQRRSTLMLVTGLLLSFVMLFAAMAFTGEAIGRGDWGRTALGVIATCLSGALIVGVAASNRAGPLTPR